MTPTITKFARHVEDHPFVASKSEQKYQEPLLLISSQATL